MNHTWSRQALGCAIFLQNICKPINYSSDNYWFPSSVRVCVCVWKECRTVIKTRRKWRVAIYVTVIYPKSLCVILKVCWPVVSAKERTWAQTWNTGGLWGIATDSRETGTRMTETIPSDVWSLRVFAALCLASPHASRCFHSWLWPIAAHFRDFSFFFFCCRDSCWWAGERHLFYCPHRRDT